MGALMPKNQSLVPMPLDKNLPMHVVARGKHPKLRHYFAPRRGVPQNWPSSIRVPIEEEIRAFGVDSIEYWTQLRIDVANLNLSFEKTKRHNLRPEDKDPETLPEYLNWWETKSPHWQSLKPRTKDNYQRRFAALIAWSKTLGNPHISKISPSLIREFVSSNSLPSEEMKATRRTSVSYTHLDVYKRQVMTAPYIPLFHTDHLAKTRFLTHEQHSVYVKLFIVMWEKGGFLEANNEALYKYSGLTKKQWDKNKEVVLDLFDFCLLYTSRCV